MKISIQRFRQILHEEIIKLLREATSPFDPDQLKKYQTTGRGADVQKPWKRPPETAGMFIPGISPRDVPEELESVSERANPITDFRSAQEAAEDLGLGPQLKSAMREARMMVASRANNTRLSDEQLFEKVMIGSQVIMNKPIEYVFDQMAQGTSTWDEEDGVAFKKLHEIADEAGNFRGNDVRDTDREQAYIHDKILNAGPPYGMNRKQQEEHRAGYKFLLWVSKFRFMVKADEDAKTRNKAQGAP
jgi:hypothetical protein